MAEDSAFRERLECTRKTILDDVEESLRDLIKNSDVTATIFYLKTHGKSRGYVEREPAPCIKTNKILDNLLAGKLTATQAAYEYTKLGLPLPAALKIQLTKAAAVVDDKNDGGATEAKLNQRYLDAFMQVSEQILSLPERKAVVDI